MQLCKWRCLLIKGLLKFFGIEITDEKIKTHWSKKYIEYLYNLQTECSYAKASLTVYLDQLTSYRKLISDVTKQIRKLSQTEKYKTDVNLLLTIPGISLLSAMIILTELESIERFKRLDQLCSYIGLIPSEHSSGEKENRGRMTRRGKSILKRIVIESSWVAIRKDASLLLCYLTLSKRMKKTRAIITIAKNS